MSVLIFFVILLVLVLVHEFGHFFSAKKFGIRVDEFGFGFPPRLFARKFGETEYSINALPFGGFVKIFGENPDLESETGADSGRALINKPRWQQAIVLSAGVFANFLLGWLLFSIAFMSGLPMSTGSVSDPAALRDVHLVVVSVLPDSPAEKAGFESGEKIISVKSGNMLLSEVNPESVRNFVVNHAESEIEIGYLDPGLTAKTAKLTPAIKDDVPMIGIAMDMVGVAQLPVFQAIWEGIKLNLTVTKEIAVGLYKLVVGALTGEGSLESVTGPVGLVSITATAAKFGFAYLLSFSALISLNLAVLNLLPFPALDGGRLFFLLLEKVKGSRINPKFANAANTIGFALLIILMLAVTYNDIVKLL